MKKVYTYHCTYCNHEWQDTLKEEDDEWKNAPCVLPCPKCKEYYVNRVSFKREGE